MVFLRVLAFIVAFSGFDAHNKRFIPQLLQSVHTATNAADPWRDSGVIV